MIHVLLGIINHPATQNILHDAKRMAGRKLILLDIRASIYLATVAKL